MFLSKFKENFKEGKRFFVAQFKKSQFSVGDPVITVRYSETHSSLDIFSYSHMSRYNDDNFNMNTKKLKELLKSITVDIKVLELRDIKTDNLNLKFKCFQNLETFHILDCIIKNYEFNYKITKIQANFYFEKYFEDTVYYFFCCVKKFEEVDFYISGDLKEFSYFHIYAWEKLLQECKFTIDLRSDVISKRSVCWPKIFTINDVEQYNNIEEAEELFPVTKITVDGEYFYDNWMGDNYDYDEESLKHFKLSHIKDITYNISE